MPRLIDVTKEKQKYCRNAATLYGNVRNEIDAKYYRMPNNPKSSSTYFWRNLLLIAPCEDGHTFIATFIPIQNQEIIVRVRFSHHPCGPLENWKKYETFGTPDKRIDIYF